MVKRIINSAYCDNDFNRLYVLGLSSNSNTLIVHNTQNPLISDCNTNINTNTDSKKLFIGESFGS